MLLSLYLYDTYTHFQIIPLALPYIKNVSVCMVFLTVLDNHFWLYGNFFDFYDNFIDIMQCIKAQTDSLIIFVFQRVKCIFVFNQKHSATFYVWNNLGHYLTCTHESNFVMLPSCEFYNISTRLCHVHIDHIGIWHFTTKCDMFCQKQRSFSPFINILACTMDSITRKCVIAVPNKDNYVIFYSCCITILTQ